MERTLQPVDLTGPEVRWAGAVSVEHREDYHKAWRIPYEDYDYFPPLGLNGNAEKSTGVRLSFISDTRVVQLKVFPSDAEYKLDILCDGHLEAIQPVQAGDTVVPFVDLPSREKRIEIYLPMQELRLAELSIEQGSSLKTFDDTRPRWITYGSSITNCATAASPSQTWPALVASSQNLHLTCLGFGGNCHAEPMVARMIRDLPADFVSLCFGINIYGGASLGPHTFQPAILGFIQIIREQHPSIPIVVCSPIISPPRETTVNTVGLCLVEMRKQILEVVEMLSRHGDGNLHYVDGLKLLGEESVTYLPDQVHPNAEGYKILAKNFEREVFSRVCI